MDADRAILKIHGSHDEVVSIQLVVDDSKFRAVIP